MKNTEKQKKNNKKQRGVTLIALIVTIVVLLILAGITIGTLTGENSLISNSKQAKEQAEISEEKEILEMATTKAMGDNQYGNIEKNSLDKELDKNIGNDSYTSERIEEGITVKFTNSNRSYLVDDNGNVTEYEIKVPVEKPETGGEVFSRANGVIDIQFLTGTSYKVGEANKPKIESDNMIPVNWNGTNWVVTSESEWDYSYDETNKKWANVMLRDTLELEGMTNEQVQTATIAQIKGKTVTKEGSMLVWIPRYSYKITYYETTDTDKTGEPIGYSDCRGLVDAEGKTPTGYPEPVTSIAVEDNYRPHPAFETDLDQGGWSKKLTGIWIGKFETTPKVNEKVTIKPGVREYTGQTIENFYIDAQNLGIANSHMAKNSEWGAMAYLTESKYGRNGIEVERNTAWHCTGGGAGLAYITNVSQSTTGNVYGIYDTAGGMYEFVAGYIADCSNSNGNSFASTDNTTNNKEESTKFSTIYLKTEVDR